MPVHLIQDRDCSANLGYLYELEGLRLIDDTSTIDFDRHQAQANFEEALHQWRESFKRKSPESSGHSPSDQKMIRFGLSDSASDGQVPIAFRLRACSILAALPHTPLPIDATTSVSLKPGDLVLRAFLALPDKTEAQRLLTLFASSSRTMLELGREREAELRLLDCIATSLSFAVREELELTIEARRRLLASAREAARNHPDAEILLHLFLLASRSCETGLGAIGSPTFRSGVILPFRSRQDV